MSLITSRDKQYLRAIYLLNGENEPVGPVKLAEMLGVSKVCAFQKMHRLQALGYGDYSPHKGLLLNETALTIINHDVRKHHIVEAFLQKNTTLTHKEACQEATNLTKSISEKLYDTIEQNTSLQISSCCGYSISRALSIDVLAKCPWMKRQLRNGDVYES